MWLIVLLIITNLSFSVVAAFMLVLHTTTMVGASA